MRRSLATVILLLASLSARPDTWIPPERRTYDSPNERWRLVVMPQDATLHRPRAELYEIRADGRPRLASRWTLVNRISPVSALVANDGTVVTFDNWAAMGHGDDVVVIYRPSGKLVRKLGLPDFLEKDVLPRLRTTAGSIWWSGTHRIDEARRILVLQIAAERTEEMRVSLETGALLDPKRRLFPPIPPPKVTWTGDDAGMEQCADAYAVPGQELEQRAIDAAVPAYPAVARKARIAGRVILDIIVGENGEVEHVVLRKPLPFGIDRASEEAVRKWRFRPLERNGKRVKMCGRVNMTFEFALTSPSDDGRR